MSKGRLLILICVFMLTGLLAYSQPGDPGGGGNPTVPITGVEFLLGGGALLGMKEIVRRIRSNHKQE
jgi:hypothetical protein